MRALWIRIVVAWCLALVVIGSAVWFLYDRETRAFQEKELVRLESTIRGAETMFRTQTNQAFSELLRMPELQILLRRLGAGPADSDIADVRAAVEDSGIRVSHSLRACCGASLHLLDRHGRSLIHQPAPGAGIGAGVPASPHNGGVYASMNRFGVEGLNLDLIGTAYRRLLPVWHEGEQMGLIEASLSPGQYLTILQRSSGNAWKHHLLIDRNALPDGVSGTVHNPTGLHADLVEPVSAGTPPAALPNWISSSRNLRQALGDAMRTRDSVTALVRDNRNRPVALSMAPVRDFQGMTIGYVMAESPADAMDALAARMAGVGGVIVILLGFLLTVGILLQHQRARSLLLREKLAAVTESVGEGVCLVDEKHRIDYVNEAGRELLGWGDRELVGLDANWVLQSGSQDAVRGSMESRMRRVTSAGETYRSDLEGFRRGDGEMLSVSVTATPLRQTPHGNEMVIVFRDVSERARELRLIRSQAMRDPLTRLPNRRVFDERLMQEVRRSRRDGGALTLLMIDVDSFKPFNDYYGHPTGDQALRQLADAMQSCMLRPLDVVCRYGGEEFAVLLPDTGSRAGQRVAERLRSTVESLGVSQAPDVGFGTLTISIGQATILAGHPDAVALLADADAALYQAKSAGGNRVVATELREKPRQQTQD
ncbi:diguanylate cyclase [Methylonatrum kenyense]|uniref:sensor domain-containing diguanylate cyclase n=1 Tax=Methylonatrum kenyense TaxID=455253 RepID=UPI0020BD6708|nr:sensor domain-containing diguanylate cyclase [Methylonatrum kenyense]MCK8514956.1 diguanylate cyclase [Methylonatrum kenyense]